MDTLVVVAQHRNHSRSQISDRFASAKSGGFKGMNCRSFESAGILPSPLPPPPQPRYRSSPIPITNKQAVPKLRLIDDACCSELWAGPAYTNSPPPSSLPIPKFSLREKRSVSLDLPSHPAAAQLLRPVAKSAPSSPTRASISPAGGAGFFLSTAFATQDLRRILNLDI